VEAVAWLAARCAATLAPLFPGPPDRRRVFAVEDQRLWLPELHSLVIMALTWGFSSEQVTSIECPLSACEAQRLRPLGALTWRP
jgi:hypothetical protein